MLGFIANEAGAQLVSPVKEFNGNTMGYLLVHIANTYKHWAANFAMKKQLPYVDENSVKNIATIQKLFDEADELMMQFLDNFPDLDVKITNTVRSGTITITVTPLELFTHMITHEFHRRS